MKLANTTLILDLFAFGCDIKAKINNTINMVLTIRYLTLARLIKL